MTDKLRSLITVDKVPSSNSSSSAKPVVSSGSPEELYANAMDYASSDDYALANSLGGKIAGTDASSQSKLDLMNTLYQNAFNSVEAQKQRDYEQMMSDTAYRRAAKDLEALGFSPLALVSGNSAASTPSGYAASNSNRAQAQASGSGALIGSLIKVLGTIAISAVMKKPSTTNVNVSNSNPGVNTPWTDKDQAEWDSLMDEISPKRRRNRIKW